MAGTKAPSHTMELPRLIVVGEGNMGMIGNFLKSLGGPSKVSLVSGANVRRLARADIEESLGASEIKWAWHLAGRNEPGEMAAVEARVKRDKSGMILGIGGGRAVDAAKMIAFNLGVPFVSVPTTASHDGIASPFVSVKGRRPHSIVASSPLGVFVDIRVIKKAPPRLLSSGCGDLIANMIAVRDWELGRDDTGEYYGRYAASLALMSAGIVMENSTLEKIDERGIVEALISAGVASGIAGSSRPCSGSEHLFSHALDKIAPGVGLHGEKCGIGSIMMAKLQGQDWRGIRRALRGVGAPTTAKQIGIDRSKIVQALVMAQSLRPERHTILSKVRMTRERALTLAKATGIV